MLFLRVENKVQHIPDIDFLCTLGESTSRGRTESIGQFGSGFIYTLALFARKGILKDCKFCLGKDVYTAIIKTDEKKDSSGSVRTISKIALKKQNGPTYDLNVSSGFGEMDWRDVTMGVREIVSNAFDGAETYNGTYDSVAIQTVMESECRAKDNVVRVYIPITDEIKDYVDCLDHYFICHRRSYNETQKVLPKTGFSPVNIYRKGVLVYSGQEKNSLFDYNVEVKINESRVISSSNAKTEASLALVYYSREDQLDKFVKDILVDGNQDYWESQISYWDINPEYLPNTKLAQERLHASFVRVLGNRVLCKDSITQLMVERKGIPTVTVKNNELYNMISRSSVLTDFKILSDLEALGNTESEPTKKVIDILDSVWNKLSSMNLTNGRDKPPVKCFNSAVNSGSQTFGYCSSDYTKIYIHEDISNDNGNQLYSVMLEEVAHYITKSSDFTRDFQTFFVNLAARLMRE